MRFNPKPIMACMHLVLIRRSVGRFLGRSKIISCLVWAGSATLKFDMFLCNIHAGQFYEDIVEQLAQRALGAMAQKSPGHKLIVGIAGAPGSGYVQDSVCIFPDCPE
jgi:hypothetical protein